MTATPMEVGPPGTLASPIHRVEDHSTTGSIARVIGIGYGVTALALVAVGLVLTKVLDGTALGRWDRQVIVDFASDRTTSQNRLSAFWSKSADAPYIVGVALIIMLVLALGRHWREIAWVGVVLATELALFLTVSYIVGRVRPDVAHLGSVPSTGSFPSGHIAVTVALYATVATLIRRHIKAKVAGWSAIIWMVIAAVFVGWARMYRGMHHPIDVIAGAALGLAVWRLGVRAFTEKSPQNKELLE